MKILLFGCDGQVGWELQRSLAVLGELISLRRTDDRRCGDLTNLDGIAATIKEIRPDVIVNAAAYTAVDKAESDKDTAALINARAPGVMAREAAAIGALLVHYSTDYVFDGSGVSRWKENDAVAPLSVYGQTKLEGELAIVASGCRHLILRTSWVYAARGGNFAKTMLRLASSRETLNVVADQIGAPTSAELLADAAAHAISRCMAQSGLDGIYHLTAAGEVSWHGYARFVIDYARQAGVELLATAEHVFPVPSSEFPVAAQRPLNSRLDTTKFRETFGVRLAPWQDGVLRMLAEITEKKI